MATPKAKPKAKQDKLPARQAAEVVLLENGKPMHYREITRVALEQGIVKVKKGATPEQTEKTMRSYLAGCAQMGVKFKRVDPGVFDLKSRPRKRAKSGEKKEAASKR